MFPWRYGSHHAYPLLAQCAQVPDPEVAPVIVKYGQGGGVIVTAMENSANDPWVQHQACRCIAHYVAPSPATHAILKQL